MRVLVVDDHQLILEGFKKELKLINEDYQVYLANNQYSMFSILEQESIDLIFLDIRLKDSDARSFISKVLKNHPNVKIIIVSSLSAHSTIQTLLNQGASAYLLKSDPKEEIKNAIDSVLNNQQYISVGIRDQPTYQKIKGQEIRLTPREKEILALIIEGKTSKEISDEIFVSPKTVENHRANLFGKFGVKNVASLVKMAIIEGYMD